jgi:hypothetical protein
MMILSFLMFETAVLGALGNKMLLVACEESQAVTIAFREKRIEAYSCDLISCSGGHPEWHIQGDVCSIIKGNCSFKTMDGTEHRVGEWDGVIAFPPCTYLTVTGNRWFSLKEDPNGIRAKKREDAAAFFEMFYNLSVRFIAIENPIGVMSTRLCPPTQIVEPYWFGDAYEKKTCLWLKGLPKLTPTDMVAVPKPVEFASGRKMSVWYQQSWNLPRKQRALFRSKTPKGLAEAMAAQWASVID